MTKQFNDPPLPFSVNHEDATAYWHADILWLMLATGEQTGGTYSLIEEFCPKNSGPPPHHHEQDEAFHVIEGEITFQTGDQILKATTGSFVSIPRGTIHAFRVDSEVAHLLNFYTPAGFEQTVIELGQPAPTRCVPPKGVDKQVSPEQIKVLFQKVGMHPSNLPDTLRLEA